MTPETANLHNKLAFGEPIYDVIINHVDDRPFLRFYAHANCIEDRLRYENAMRGQPIS